MMTDNDATKLVKSRARAAKITAAPPPPPAPVPPAAKTTSKSDTVIKLLLRAKGATPIELIAATDWQPHSLRAFLSGLRKKGRDVTREERKGGGYAYRIVADKTAVPTGAGGLPPEAVSTDGVASTDTGKEAAVTGQAAHDEEGA